MKKFLFASFLAAAVLPAAALEASAADVVKRIQYRTYTLRCSVLHSGGQTHFLVQNHAVSSIPKGHKIEVSYRTIRGMFRPPQSTTVVAHADVRRGRGIVFAGVSGARRCSASVKMHPIAAVL